MKQLPIKYNKWIPFKRFFAMCLFGIIYIRDFNKDRKVHKSTLNHEGIHLCQIEDFVPNKNGKKWKTIFGGCIFYILYFIEWLIKLVISGFTLGKVKAYRSVSFEQEAYNNQYYYTYQKNRKRFAWFKYVFKLVKK
jgi:hypothetical protein